MRITEMLATYMDMTDAIQDYIEKKLSGLEKFCEGYSPCDIRVEVGKTSEHHNKGKIYRAEYQMSIPGASFRAEAIEEDLYAAIDDAKDDLKRQLIAHKEKQQGR